LRSDPLFQEPLAKNMISGFGYGREKLRKEGNLRVLVFQREGKYEGRETRAGGPGRENTGGKRKPGLLFWFLTWKFLWTAYNFELKFALEYRLDALFFS
jgi:hypothetical protein